jgi:hypothetical protein
MIPFLTCSQEDTLMPNQENQEPNRVEVTGLRPSPTPPDMRV